MTYHIKLQDYTCSNCKNIYIPYKADLPCPDCKYINKDVPEEYFSFIDQLIKSMEIHKRSYRIYMPPAWISSTYSENIQSIIFKLFDALKIHKPTDKDAFITKWLSGAFRQDDPQIIYIKKIYTTVDKMIVHSKKEQRNRIIRIIYTLLIWITVLSLIFYFIPSWYHQYLVNKHLKQGYVDPSSWNCPDEHPIKANSRSMIYHEPWDQYWPRTNAMNGKCFDTAENAEKFGYRPIFSGN